MLLAIDTNPLIDWALGDEDVIDCFDLIKRRISSASICVPPTVLIELAHFAKTNAKGLGKSALKALELIRDEQPFLKPINLIPVGHGIVEINGQKIRASKLIPVEEIHDSFILAEACLLNCEILISTDSHLTGMDHDDFCKVAKGFDGSSPIIRSPKQLVAQFGLRR